MRVLHVIQKQLDLDNFEVFYVETMYNLFFLNLYYYLTLINFFKYLNYISDNSRWIVYGEGDTPTSDTPSYSIHAQNGYATGSHVYVMSP